MADADTPPPPEGPIDFDRLLKLVELMEKHGLTEVSLRRGTEKWKLRRGPEAAAPMTTGFPAPAAPAPAGPSSAAASPTQPKADGTVTINSPTVGTYYASPTPDDPPFVKIGSTVQPETVVCIVEAMKVFNQIPA